MYYEPSYIHVELTDKCNARCPLCPRTDHNDVSKTTSYVTDSEITFEQFKLILGNKVDTLKSYNFCGNYGDPLSAKDFLKIVEYVAKPDVQVRIHTNGSVKTTDYFKKLGKILSVNPNNVLSFDLDGLEDTHSFYRRNTNFNKIINNAKAFIASTSAKARWQYLIFDHNKHQVESAKIMAKELGFFEFKERYSTWFGPTGQEDFVDNGKMYTIKMAHNKNVKVKVLDKIQCTAIERKGIYLSAKGHIWPCCHTATRAKVDVHIKEMVDKYSINSIDGNLHTIDEIMEGMIWTEIELRWPTQTPLGCKQVCGYRNNRSPSTIEDL